MFVVVPNPTFESDVALTVPGAAEPATLRVTWRHLGRKAQRAWIERPSRQQQPGAAEPATLDDAAYLGEVIAGWSGAVDDKGAPAAYSQEALASLLDAYPASGGELFNAYLRALTESRAKN